MLGIMNQAAERCLTGADAGTPSVAHPFFQHPQRRRKTMLGRSDATPMLAVKDLDRARKFYEDKLGLKQVDDFGEGFMLKSGDTKLSVYRSEFAGTNKATTLTFDVDDIDNEVRALKEKGIAFEHYELEGLTPKGDIFEGEQMKTAWFKDPDGNILSLIEGK
jgi:catechol 2,3-dioxygenase-like lactoylglutathione lyase family enzyme